MSRLLGFVVVYALMFLGWAGVGLFVIFAPARFGNLVNENFGFFPHVESGDWARNWCYDWWARACLPSQHDSRSELWLC
jgi:hypothetical protein